MKRFKAFTLAEVLITLGVIGVVVAITIPNLIKNYKKHEIAVRLEQNYNIIQNAIQMSIAENGDYKNWDGYDSGSAKTFFENYIFKHMKFIKSGTLSAEELGYNHIYNADGKTDFFLPIATKSSKYVMANGSIILIVMANNAKNSSNKTVYYSYDMFIDLNGSKGPNTIGKDIFNYFMPLNGTKLLSLGLEKLSFDTDTEQYTYRGNYSHSELVSECAKTTNNALSCGALIQESGWKIPDDYPLKF